MFLSLGPLLSPLSALGLLPLASQLVPSPVRRGLQVAAAALAAVAAGALGGLPQLGVEAAAHPLPVAESLWRTVLDHPSGALLGLGLAVSAVLLPHARNRGPWPIAGFGAAMLALTVLPAPGVPAFSLVAATWATCVLLALEPCARARRSRPLR